jgi:hypothetical protein
MGATQSESKSMKFYSLKAKVNETDTPHFAQTEKVGDKWQVTNKFDTMSGMLNSATIEEKEYQGAKFKTFVLVFADDTETSKVELTHNSITHNIINCLATDCNSISTYKIYVDKKKSKDGKYMNGRAFVNMDGSQESMKWSVDPQSAPKKVAVMVNGQPFLQQGKQVWDDSELRAFWEKIFMDKIASKFKKPAAGSATTNNTSTTPPVTAQNAENEEMPF